MTVETEQFPVASVRRIVVVVMVLVMDRELAEFLAVKLSSAVRADPWKHLERLLSIGLLQLCLGAPRHGGLGMKIDSVRVVTATSLRGLLDELCAGPTKNPDGWFDPS